MAITQISRIQVRHGLQVDLPPNLAVGELGYCTDSQRLFIGNGPSISNTEFATSVGTDLTYTASSRIIASSTGADATLPLFTATEAGLVPLSGGGTTNFLRADGTWAAPSISNFSTTSTTAGLVPGSNNQTTLFLKGDGTWAAPSIVSPTWVDIGGGDYSTAAYIEFDSDIGTSTLFVQTITTTGGAGQATFDTVQVNKIIIENVASVDALDVATSTASLFWKTVSGPTTFTFAAPGSGSELASFTLEITNSGGAQDITWPLSVKWPGGTQPTETAGIDIYTFYTRDNGTTWRGALVASYTS